MGEKLRKGEVKQRLRAIEDREGEDELGVESVDGGMQGEGEVVQLYWDPDDEAKLAAVRNDESGGVKSAERVVDDELKTRENGLQALLREGSSGEGGGEQAVEGKQDAISKAPIALDSHSNSDPEPDREDEPLAEAVAIPQQTSLPNHVKKHRKRWFADLDSDAEDDFVDPSDKFPNRVKLPPHIHIAKAKWLAETSEVRKERQKLHRQHYHTLIEEMRKQLNLIMEFVKTSSASKESIEKVKVWLDRCQVLRETIKSKYENRRRPDNGARQHIPRDHRTTVAGVNKLIEGPEEAVRPSICTSETPIPDSGLLMRVTDESSMAKLHADIGFLSHGSEAVFYTDRRFELSMHCNWGLKHKTPFISVTDSVWDYIHSWIPKFTERDAKNPGRCTVKLTFINANARKAAGWPMVKMVDELKHYKAEIPDRCCFATYNNEYILLFRVPTDHIVGTYCWPEVKRYMSQHNCGYETWHENVVVPAYREHEKVRLEGRAVPRASSCVCCPEHNPENVKVRSEDMIQR